ncbi:MAG: rRNA maturation RNase YbeY [Candidatus Omnitrophica bacterium]|nr:rRNA maturation RNase YbeY [Candidatus Omnitrophota bacterium]
MKSKISNLQRKTIILKKEIKKKIKKILFLQNKKDANLSIVLTNDQIIKNLNREFLGKNYPTDVLAFNLKNKNQAQDSIEAEIIISIETAEKNSKIYKTSFKYETLLYLVHGILHLCGYDDRRKNDRERMRKREEYILRKIN